MNFYVEMLSKTEVVNVSSPQWCVLGTILKHRIRFSFMFLKPTIEHRRRISIYHLLHRCVLTRYLLSV